MSSIFRWKRTLRRLAIVLFSSFICSYLIISSIFSKSNTPNGNSFLFPDFYYTENENYQSNIDLININQTFQQYLSVMQAKFENRSGKVLQYRCEQAWKCGGLGDRLRGLTATFVMALFLNESFSCHWSSPSDLDAYFELPFGAYLNVSSPDVPAHLLERRSHFTVKSINVVDNDTAIETLFRKPFSNFITTMKTVDYLRININSWLPVQFIMADPIYGQVRSYYNLTGIPVDHLLSQSLRFLLSKPRKRLENITNKVLSLMGNNVGGNETVVKIGVHIRLENSDWGEDGRVSYNQIGCFAIETKKIIESFDESSNISIFIASDSEAAVDEFSSQIAQIQPSVKSKIFFLNGPIGHIDRLILDDNKLSIGKVNEKTFGDWLLLTKMDFLVISRSSFGETAAIHSLAPTRRFQHWHTAKCQFENYKLNNLHMESS